MGSGGREAPRQPERPAPAEVRQAVSDLNSYVQVLERDIVFSVDAASGKSIIRVVDAETGEVIRQIPPEEVVAVSRALANSFQEITGLLLNDKG
ncbi:MAG: flagellar protein FlaG [Gammaproteobacteria bacterium]|nr:MAG: flagellar protein FlaG [Gammaproteobacteria bacterium]